MSDAERTSTEIDDYDDFEDLPIETQRASYEHDYLLGTTTTRFMDDLHRMFVTEDCGGDMNFVIFDLDGKSSSFASLHPAEVFRLLTLLREKVASYWTDDGEFKMSEGRT